MVLDASSLVTGVLRETSHIYACSRLPGLAACRRAPVSWCPRMSRIGWMAIVC